MQIDEKKVHLLYLDTENMNVSSEMVCTKDVLCPKFYLVKHKLIGASVMV